ncbi:MAG: alpha/beta hydrolase domain-containing protein [Paraperlucidibaca sp.]
MIQTNECAMPARHTLTTRWMMTGLLLAVLGLAGCGSNLPTKLGIASSSVPTPMVAGPVTGGSRTGKPFATTLLPLTNGYVEEEFIISGKASGYGTSAGSQAEYVTRIVVRRPENPAAFNGTVVMHWNNVTSQQDVEAIWIEAAETIMRRGYIYVGVSAQKQGVDGSPLALAFWDPVRYPSVSHPGDDFSYDIFSQTTQAVLRDPVILGAETLKRAEVTLAVGSSQSGTFLSTYINEFHEVTGLFDGYLPMMLGEPMRDDVAPTLAVNSQDEAGGRFIPSLTQPDSGLFRQWEVTGPSHLTNFGGMYIVAQSAYNYGSAGPGIGPVNTLDPETMNEYGEMSLGGLCLYSNRFPRGHVWSAALVALDRWVRSGVAPASVAHIEKDASGAIVFDEHNNAVGGFRHPVIDVPVASYYAGQEPGYTKGPCSFGGNIPLLGTTETFTYVKLAQLYPTKQDYLDKLQAAVDAAVASDHMLDEHAKDLMRRARNANLYGVQ